MYIFSVCIVLIHLSDRNVSLWLKQPSIFGVFSHCWFCPRFPADLSGSSVEWETLQLAVPCAPLQLKLVLCYRGAAAFHQSLQTQLLWQILLSAFGTGIPEQGKGQSNVSCFGLFLSEELLKDISLSSPELWPWHVTRARTGFLMSCCWCNKSFCSCIQCDLSHVLMQKNSGSWILCHMKSAKLSKFKPRQL